MEATNQKIEETLDKIDLFLTQNEKMILTRPKPKSERHSIVEIFAREMNDCLHSQKKSPFYSFEYFPPKTQEGNDQFFYDGTKNQTQI